jgi:hypothetical protein
MAARTRPYDFQAKVNSMNHPDVVGFVERIAAVCHAAGQPLPWPKSAAMMPIR